MKAAVLHNFGETPRYEDFPDPTKGERRLTTACTRLASLCYASGRSRPLDGAIFFQVHHPWRLTNG